MAYCNAGGGCAVSCSGGCYALRVHRTARCYRGCTGSPLKVPGQFTKIDGSEVVTLSVNGVTLLDVGLALGKIHKRKIAVPAEKALRKVSIKNKEASLDTLLESLGLIAQ